MQGTQAQAGRDMTLAAGRDLTIHAAQSTAGSESSGGSFSAGLGLAASAGTTGYSLGLTGNAALAGNQANGDSLTYSNAKLVAGEKLTTISGQDTTVAGANLTAKDVDMHVGRDLTVASLQDTGSSSSSNYGLSGSVTTGYGANWDPFKSVDGSEISKATGIEGYGENIAKVLEKLLNYRNDAKLDPNQTLQENMGGVADTIFNKGQQNPSGKYKEQYQASVSGGISEGHSKSVGEQTSILGSDSVNIYTEGNTHVAGAIIAALNDNLKLDTGSLSYENLVGKTTQTSTSAGVDWTFSPVQKDDKGKKEPGGGGSEGGKTDPQPGQSAQSEEQKAAEKKRLEEEKKKKEDEFYKHTPGWMRPILVGQKDTQNFWNTFKKDKLYGVTPGKFTHIEKETTQTAYATIGKGEIIVRNNPGQSLEGLNRDLSQAMKTEQTKDVNIDLKPAFSYVNDALSGWGWPDNIKGGIDFFADPREFLHDVQKELAKKIPFLKLKEIPKAKPNAPAADASPSSPSSPGPLAAGHN